MRQACMVRGFLPGLCMIMHWEVQASLGILCVSVQGLGPHDKVWSLFQLAGAESLAQVGSAHGCAITLQPQQKLRAHIMAWRA